MSWAPPGASAPQFAIQLPGSPAPGPGPLAAKRRTARTIMHVLAAGLLGMSRCQENLLLVVGPGRGWTGHPIRHLTLCDDSAGPSEVLLALGVGGLGLQKVRRPEGQISPSEIKLISRAPTLRLLVLCRLLARWDSLEPTQPARGATWPLPSTFPPFFFDPQPGQPATPGIHEPPNGLGGDGDGKDSHRTIMARASPSSASARSAGVF